jgi:hypothetical protein
MEVHLAAELQAQLDQLVAEIGCAPEKLIEDALAYYVPDLAQTRQILADRYDDLKSGKVKLIPGDEVTARLREKSTARRSTPGA